MTKIVSHPAKYSDALIPVMASMLDFPNIKSILDPFAGTGKIFELYGYLGNEIKIEGIEIESEWVSLDERLTLGNALELKYSDDLFDAICTSPSYGNKMAGKMSKDIDKGRWRRIKYADSLHRDLSTDNSANFVWGRKYREFHVKAWMEARRVLKNNGYLILNIKNHIREGKEQLVTEWHMGTLTLLGFDVTDHIHVPVPSMRFGRNSEKRISYESVIRFKLYK